VSKSNVMPLYPTEAQIAREVLGPGRLDEWKGLVQVLEREGFPPIQPRYGGRYWEACLQWFRIKNGLSNFEGAFGIEDGGETCPKPKRKRQDSHGGSAATVHRLPTG
jgi:hypothetical protein